MNAEVSFSSEMLAQSLVKGTDGKRNATPFLYNGSDICRQLVINLIHRPSIQVNERFRGINKVIELFRANQGITQGQGALRVDFTDNDGGMLHGMTCHIDTYSETRITRFVWRGNLDKGHIDPDSTGFKQPGNTGKPARNQVDPSLPDGFAGQPA